MELQVLDKQNNQGMMEVAVSRQAQEVQAAMIIAQRFPRDINRAYTRAIEDCKRKSLAEKAIYSYPRGKGENAQIVTGPSIRLAETVAKAFGNIDFGVIEIERKSPVGNLAGESTVMTFSWDLESNVRSSNVFTVKHRRDTKSGGYNLTDERDIYEMVANYAARRKRANILSTVPADFVEKCLEQCRLTLKTSTEPLVDRIRKMVLAFKDLGVSQEMLEKRLSHKIDITTEDEIVDLIGVYNSIKEGQADRADFFDLKSNDDKPTEGTQSEGQQQNSQTEVKSLGKTVKNHAPQTSEEAKARNAEKSQQGNSQQAAKPTRQKIAEEILAIGKQYGTEVIEQHSGGIPLKEMSDDGMAQMLVEIKENLQIK